MKIWMGIQKEEFKLNNNGITKSMKYFQQKQNKDRGKQKTTGLIT